MADPPPMNRGSSGTTFVYVEGQYESSESKESRRQNTADPSVRGVGNLSF